MKSGFFLNKNSLSICIIKVNFYFVDIENLNCKFFVLLFSARYKVRFTLKLLRMAVMEKWYFAITIPKRASKCVHWENKRRKNTWKEGTSKIKEKKVDSFWFNEAKFTQKWKCMYKFKNNFSFRFISNSKL